MIGKANIYPFNNLKEVINFLQFKDVFLIGPILKNMLKR